MLIVEFTKSKTPKNGGERYLNRKNRDDEEGERGLRKATKGLLYLMRLIDYCCLFSSEGCC